ncbi:MAG: hypothetical protein COU51_01630 [Parcubacteria group bacterium CG10_big_fil_rev_8_21_14_0_10_36_14]|nr:MAG: hypothetical protein COU51_01630 [Parcubacteria group bacterium CG10_big_fil_rev_8_21_14_0_10_36_14]
MSGKQNGLSQFRDETAREERREERKAKREKREAERDKRRKERLAAQPVGMGGQKDEGGNGTSRKSRQKAKKRSPGSRFFRNDNHGMAVRHKK